MTNPLEETLGKAIENIVEGHNDSNQQTKIDQPLELIKLHGLLLQKHEFHIGDLVEWKPGLKNKRADYKKPMIVTKIYEKPITELTDDTGSPYFNEQLDIVCGEIILDGNFLEFHFDSRRFQPWQPEQGDTSDA